MQYGNIKIRGKFQNLKTRDFISALHEFLSVVEIGIELFVSTGEKDSAKMQALIGRSKSSKLIG